jgi:hypothetical protein
MPRLTHRWPFWLALIAVLWTSLSPALARVWVDAVTERVEICTSTGVVWVSVEAPTDGTADPGGSPAGAATVGMACDWCLLHAGAWDIPPGARVVPVDPVAAHTLARASILLAFDDELWWRPLSHAPPLLSLHRC